MRGTIGSAGCEEGEGDESTNVPSFEFWGLCRTVGEGGAGSKTAARQGGDFYFDERKRAHFVRVDAWEEAMAEKGSNETRGYVTGRFVPHHHEKEQERVSRGGWGVTILGFFASGMDTRHGGPRSSH